MAAESNFIRKEMREGAASPSLGSIPMRERKKEMKRRERFIYGEDKKANKSPCCRKMKVRVVGRI